MRNKRLPDLIGKFLIEIQNKDESHIKEAIEKQIDEVKMTLRNAPYKKTDEKYHQLYRYFEDLRALKKIIFEHQLPEQFNRHTIKQIKWVVEKMANNNAINKEILNLFE